MIKVKIDASKMNTPARRQKAVTAAEHLEIILNSKEFKEKILNMPPRWRRGSTGPFKHKSNREIYEAIMGAKETFWGKKADKVLHLFVDDYYRPWSKVVGYIIPGLKRIHVNTKFFDNMSVLRVCSNFAHEGAGHHIGMLHGGKYFKESIPYYLNKVIEELYPKLIDIYTPVKRKPRFFRWYNPFSWF